MILACLTGSSYAQWKSADEPRLSNLQGKTATIKARTKKPVEAPAVVAPAAVPAIEEERIEPPRVAAFKSFAPAPRTQQKALPPVTRTIFDDIDEPFAPEEEIEATVVAPAEVAEPALVERPTTMREYLERQAGVLEQDDLHTSRIQPVEDAVVVQPQPESGAPFEQAAPLVESSVPQNTTYFTPSLQTAQAEPALQPQPDSESQLDRAVSTGSGLKPLSEIQPYFDYSPDGADPYEFLCPPPSSDPNGKTYDCPPVSPLEGTGNLDRAFGGMNYMWTAANLYHNPLYFEDPNLERYGLSHHPALQPIMSVSRFTGQVVTLPYHVALSPPDQIEYTLGWWRPQDICTPRKRTRVPWNAKAAATAAGTYTGLIFLFP